MKKLFFAALFIVGLLYSCDPQASVEETQEIYGIDKDKVETPGNKGGNG